MSMPTETITKIGTRDEGRGTRVEHSSLVPHPSFLEDKSLAEKGFYWREREGIKALVCRPLEELGFTNGFSTRLGGVSPFPENDLNLAGYDDDSAENIAENRRRFLNLFEGDWRIASCWQVHSDEIRHVKSYADAVDANCKMDALVSDAERVLLGVKTADCVPILLGDPKTKGCAAVHAGWRGTVESIVVKTVRRMQKEFGTNPQDLTAAIGPAATCQNYEVGDDVIKLFRQNFSETYQKYFRPTRENHALVDLHQANFDQLVKADISSANIFVAPFCTMERTDLFFSYRQEKKLRGKTGRLLSVIGKS